MSDFDRVMKFAITIEDTSERYDCAPDESLLAGMVRLGRRGIPAGCCGGGCGVCKIEIIAGVFEARAMSRDHVSADDQEKGRVLACRIYPRSDLSLRVLGKMHKTVCGRNCGGIGGTALGEGTHT